MTTLRTAVKYPLRAQQTDRNGMLKAISRSGRTVSAFWSQCRPMYGPPNQSASPVSPPKSRLNPMHRRMAPRTFPCFDTVSSATIRVAARLIPDAAKVVAME